MTQDDASSRPTAPVEPRGQSQPFAGMPPMLSIRPFLLRFYYKLPVIRELRTLRDRFYEDRVHHEDFVRRLLQEDRYARSKRLNRYEHQVFSQNGEDGIIREVFRRIGTGGRVFLEIGVDGPENNTTFLLTQGWQGYWIEGDRRSVARIRRAFRGPLAGGQLTLLQSVVTMENVAESLRRLEVPGEIDLFSLDVDRNSYWILSAVLPVVRPRVLVVEYNATYPPDVEWMVEYDRTRWWNGSSYFGASLKAYESLCRTHGLSLVGCDLHGVNAIFVRQELCGDRFEEPFTAETHYEPVRYYLGRREGHPRCFSDLAD